MPLRRQALLLGAKPPCPARGCGRPGLCNLPARQRQPVPPGLAGCQTEGKARQSVKRIAGLFACAGRQSGRAQAGRLPALARLLALYAFLGCHIFFSNRLLTKIRLTSWATTTPPSTTAGNT